MDAHAIGGHVLIGVSQSCGNRATLLNYVESHCNGFSSHLFFGQLSRLMARPNLPSNSAPFAGAACAFVKRVRCCQYRVVLRRISIFEATRSGELDYSSHILDGFFSLIRKHAIWRNEST